jgi:hypothetical protein
MIFDYLKEDLKTTITVTQTDSPEVKPELQCSEINVYRNMNPDRFMSHVHASLDPLPIEDWDMEYKPDIFIDMDIALEMDGYREVEKGFTYSVSNGAMFERFQLAQWYDILRGIAEKGLSYPVFASVREDGISMKYRILDGVNRVQALHILGYEQVPVIFEKGE